MPRAAHSVADEKTFGEGPAVMRATSGDSKNLIALPRKKHGVTRRVPDDHRPVGEITFLYSLAEIGPRQLTVLHGNNDT